MSEPTTYKVQYQPRGAQAMSSERADTHDQAQSIAEDRAGDGATAVTVLRHDPTTGWDIAGWARPTYPQGVVYHDLRTASQVTQDADRALDDAEQAHGQPHEPQPEKLGRRSGMRVFPTAFNCHRLRRRSP